MGKPEDSPKPRRRLGRRIIAVLGCLLLLVAMAPYVIAKTPLLNAILGRIGAKDDLSITIQSAELGWFTPTNLQGLQIERQQPQVKVRVECIQLDRSWFASWMALPNMGRIKIVSPEIDLAFSQLPQETPKFDPPSPRPILGELIVTNATLRVRAAQDQAEIVKLDHLDVAARIESASEGRTLTIDPVTLLDHVALTPQLCDRGLQLVAPILANSTSVSGSVSLELQKCIVPIGQGESLDSAERSTIAGALELHHVQTSLKESIFRDIAAVVAGLLRRDLPDAMRIADNTQVRFELQDGRVYHEGLTFLLPEISEDMVWRTKGSVGLDETLDLVLQAQLPAELMGKGPLASRLAERPIELHIGGTLDKPQLKPPRDGYWLKEAAGLLTGDGTGDEPLVETLNALRERIRIRREEGAEQGGSTILDRMRERLKTRQEKRRRGTEPDATHGGQAL